MAEIALLPRLSQDCKFEDFKHWKTQFSAFVELVVPGTELDTKGLNYLKYAISGARLDIDFDGRATLKSALERVENLFVATNQPSFPLRDYFNCKQDNMSINSYVAKLRSFLFFLDNNDAKDQMIKQKLLEELSDELRLLLSELSLKDIVSHLTKLPSRSNSTTVCASTNNMDRMVCYNCGKRGHGTRTCSEKKSFCGNCNRSGHQRRFCYRISKNAAAATLSSVEQAGQAIINPSTNL